MSDKIISVFFDNLGITFIGMATLMVFLLTFSIAGLNKYSKWQCNNYETMTGFESKYVEWDACYIKGSDSIFIRYDSNYKSVN